MGLGGGGSRLAVDFFVGDFKGNMWYFYSCIASYGGIRGIVLIFGQRFPVLDCSSHDGSRFVTAWGLEGPVPLLLLRVGDSDTPLVITQGGWPALLGDVCMWGC